jgi:uncharacterized protein
VSRLKNKVVVITGASSGIGRAAALAFARDGARLMLAARRESELVRVCEEVRAAGGEAGYQITDVANEKEVTDLIDKTITQYGRIDILVNNAGYGHFRRIADTSSEEMHRIMDVNYFGTFYASRAVLPIMQKQGSGHIINISSVAGKRVFRGEGGAYNVTKYAMQGFTEALRMELLGTSIHVSAICPVTTVTEFFDQSERQIGKPAQLKGPVQTADQVAKAIINVALNPKPEVIMIGTLRLLFALNALAPGFVDRAVERALK